MMSIIDPHWRFTPTKDINSLVAFPKFRWELAPGTNTGPMIGAFFG
jgi:hypothetical protein